MLILFRLKPSYGGMIYPSRFLVIILAIAAAIFMFFRTVHDVNTVEVVTDHKPAQVSAPVHQDDVRRPVLRPMNH